MLSFGQELRLAPGQVQGLELPVEGHSAVLVVVEKARLAALAARHDNQSDVTVVSAKHHDFISRTRTRMIFSAAFRH